MYSKEGHYFIRSYCHVSPSLNKGDYYYYYYHYYYYSIIIIILLLLLLLLLMLFWYDMYSLDNLIRFYTVITELSSSFDVKL